MASEPEAISEKEGEDEEGDIAKIAASILCQRSKMNEESLMEYEKEIYLRS